MKKKQKTKKSLYYGKNCHLFKVKDKCYGNTQTVKSRSIRPYIDVLLRVLCVGVRVSQSVSQSEREK